MDILQQWPRMCYRLFLPRSYLRTPALIILRHIVRYPQAARAFRVLRKRLVSCVQVKAFLVPRQPLDSLLLFDFGSQREDIGVLRIDDQCLLDSLEHQRMIFCLKFRPPSLDDLLDCSLPKLPFEPLTEGHQFGIQKTLSLEFAENVPREL